MIQLNRMAAVDYVDAQIAATSHEGDRRQLEVLRAHLYGEVVGDVDALLDTLTLKRVQYRNWGAPAELQPASREQVREFYEERKRNGWLYVQIDIERLTVADRVIITDGVLQRLALGRALAEAGEPGVDSGAVYLMTSRILITWPFDDSGLLVGEEIYAVPGAIRKLDDHEVPADYVQGTPK